MQKRLRAVIEGDDNDMSEALRVIKVVEDRSNHAAKEYNIVFRQASTNLIVAAGILLALSTQIVGGLQYGPLIIKFLAVSIVMALTLSVAFGMVQQLMEAAFFRKIALDNRNLCKKLADKVEMNYKKIYGMIEQMDSQRGCAVRRWPYVVQLTLLAVALLLVAITTICYLFL